MNDLWLAFIIKHFICDYPLQAFPYMYRNKGTYGHFGGVLHSLIHQIGTFIALVICGIDGFTSMWISVLEGLVHYHIDFAKMNVNRIMGWMPGNSEKFWILLGFDQLLHYMTYWVIIRSLV